MGNYTIGLDVHDMSAPVSLNVKQGESGQIIYITLRSDGLPYPIPKGAYAVFAGKKPDGKILWNSCTVVDNTIQYEITKQTTAVVGWVPVQIRVYKADGKLLMTPDFVLIVDAPVTEDAEVVAVSENEITALTELVSEAATLQKAVFWAEYGVTTYAEISAAKDEGQVVLCKKDASPLTLRLHSADQFGAKFVSFSSGINQNWSVTTDDVWSESYDAYPTVDEVLGIVKFTAEYGVTTLDEILVAKEEGKVCVCISENDSTEEIPLVSASEASAVFSAFRNGTNVLWTCYASGWTDNYPSYATPEDVKPLAVTISGAAASHSASEIIAAIQAGKIVEVTVGTERLRVTGWDESAVTVTCQKAPYPGRTGALLYCQVYTIADDKTVTSTTNTAVTPNFTAKADQAVAVAGGDPNGPTSFKGIDVQEVFTATYGSTTFAEIYDAVSAGKAVYCKNGNVTMPMTKYIPQSITATFGGVTESGSVVWKVQNATWSSYNAEIGGSDSGGNASLTSEQISALDGMFKVCAFIKADVSAEYNAFKTAFGIEDSEEEGPDEPVVPEVTLTSISATYSGGDVAVGTAVTALTGIVVTAHYSDGTSVTVTGYTLSGTIAEGSNTVTVSYGGETTTFSVTGVAESGGDGNFISIPVTRNTNAIARNLYADGGTTLLREDAFTSWCWTSDETFDADTRVKFLVTPGWPNTRNSSIFVGSTMTGSEVYFAEGVKGETTADASYDGSTVEKIVTVKAGHKAILVYSNGIAVTAAMEADIVRCTGISLSADTLEFTGAGSKTLIATVTPNNCTQPVFWESSNPNIVTVENGVVTAINNGKETITARCGAYSASCSVSASGFVVAPLCPLADGTCTVTGNAGSGETGKITITNGNHINMTRTWAYNPIIPASDLPETRKQNEGGMVCNSELFPLKTGDEVRTVVRFSDTNAHVAGLSVRLYASTGVWNEYIEVLTGITESGEATYTVEADWSAGGIAVYLEAGTGVLDCDIEIYVNGARYV